MEPLKIQVEVSLSETTIEVLKKIAAVAIWARTGSEDIPAAQAAPETAAPQEAPEEPVDKYKDVPFEDLPDMPDFEAEEAKKPEAPKPLVISDDEITKATRETVTRLKKAGQSPVIIRTELFTKYGISQSTECPADKRQEFIEALDKIGR